MPTTIAGSRLRRSPDSCVFHKTHEIVGAAKPREHPTGEGEDAEDQTRSKGDSFAHDERVFGA